MFGRGAVNGAAVNTYPVNGGVFVIEAAGTVQFPIAPISTAVRRRIGASAVELTVTPVVAATRRRVAAAAVSIGKSHTVIAVRRRVAAGTTALLFSPTTTVVRRAVATSAVAIELGTVINLGYFRFAIAPLTRTIYVTRPTREMLVPAHTRVMKAAPDARLLLSHNRERRRT